MLLDQTLHNFQVKTMWLGKQTDTQNIYLFLHNELLVQLGWKGPNVVNLLPSIYIVGVLGEWFYLEPRVDILLSGWIFPSNVCKISFV